MHKFLSVFLSFAFLFATQALAQPQSSSARKPAAADDKIEVQKTLKDVERKLTQTEIEAKVRAQLPKKDSKTPQN